MACPYWVFNQHKRAHAHTYAHTHTHTCIRSCVLTTFCSSDHSYGGLNKIRTKLVIKAFHTKGVAIVNGFIQHKIWYRFENWSIWSNMWRNLIWRRVLTCLIHWYKFDKNGNVVFIKMSAVWANFVRFQY